LKVWHFDTKSQILSVTVAVGSHGNTSAAAKSFNVSHMHSKKQILMPSQLLAAHLGCAVSLFGLQLEEIFSFDHQI
jgi:hypothetical protein